MTMPKWCVLLIVKVFLEHHQLKFSMCAGTKFMCTYVVYILIYSTVTSRWMDGWMDGWMQRCCQDFGSEGECPYAFWKCVCVGGVGRQGGHHNLPILFNGSRYRQEKDTFWQYHGQRITIFHIFPPWHNAVFSSNVTTAKLVTALYIP